MTALTLLGWVLVASLAFGFTIAAIGGQLVSLGFSGRGMGWPFYFLLSIGLGLGAVAWYLMPFTLYLNTGVSP